MYSTHEHVFIYGVYTIKNVRVFMICTNDCVHVQSYVYMYIYMYLRVGVYIYVCVCIYVCMCTCVCVGGCMWLCVDIMHMHLWFVHKVPYEWVMSHMNGSCLVWMCQGTYERVISPMNEPCPIWMGHVPYEWVMSHMNNCI